MSEQEQKQGGDLGPQNDHANPRGFSERDLARRAPWLFGVYLFFAIIGFLNVVRELRRTVETGDLWNLTTEVMVYAIGAAVVTVILRVSR